jgi:heme-degrading monooxygenase HmoA
MRREHGYQPSPGGSRKRSTVIVRIVRFRSGLQDEDVLSAFESRSARYRDVEGLRQKYYLRFPQTGEFGAVYVWESQRALDQFNESELARSIPDVYRVDGAPGGESGDVILSLYPDAGSTGS